MSWVTQVSLKRNLMGEPECHRVLDVCINIDCQLTTTAAEMLAAEEATTAVIMLVKHGRTTFDLDGEVEWPKNKYKTRTQWRKGEKEGSVVQSSGLEKQGNKCCGRSSCSTCGDVTDSVGCVSLTRRFPKSRSRNPMTKTARRREEAIMAHLRAVATLQDPLDMSTRPQENTSSWGVAARTVFRSFRGTRDLLGRDPAAVAAHVAGPWHTVCPSGERRFC